MFVTLLALVLAACSCPRALPAESSAPPATATATATATSGDEDQANVDALLGFWAEYWAVVGEAQTQRYLFLPDGRYGWLAAPGDPQPVLRRSGRWAFEQDVLVLSETARLERACAETPCDQAPRAVANDAPVEQRLELGDCPDNAEARELDQHYQCRSIGGRAFWRRSGPDGDDPAPFFR
jgi:hypothetical protein